MYKLQLFFIFMYLCIYWVVLGFKSLRTTAIGCVCVHHKCKPDKIHLRVGSPILKIIYIENLHAHTPLLCDMIVSQ